MPKARRVSHPELVRGMARSRHRQFHSMTPSRLSHLAITPANLLELKTTLQLYAHSVSEDRLAAEGEALAAFLQAPAPVAVN